jgi:uncharacterized protein (DUF1499 family)
MTAVSVGCSGKHLKVKSDDSLALKGCTPLPNCVSSTTWILYNKTSDFKLKVSGEKAWPKIKQVVSDMKRTEIKESSDVYIHAQSKSMVFRFVDNLELLRHPGTDTVSVRSSSMIAIFDFFVNRMRIHKLRKELRESDLIE